VSGSTMSQALSPDGRVVDSLPRTARVGVPSISALSGGETIRSAISSGHRLYQRKLTRAWAFVYERKYISDDQIWAHEDQTHPRYS
jgi:hypothetical protein